MYSIFQSLIHKYFIHSVEQQFKKCSRGILEVNFNKLKYLGLLIFNSISMSICKRSKNNYLCHFLKSKF